MSEGITDSRRQLAAKCWKDGSAPPSCVPYRYNDPPVKSVIHITLEVFLQLLVYSHKPVERQISLGDRSRELCESWSWTFDKLMLEHVPGPPRKWNLENDILLPDPDGERELRNASQRWRF